MSNIISRFGEQTLLTRDEVAALFRVHPRTVLEWVRRGRLVSTRTPGGRHRYKESDVRALLAGDQDEEGGRS